MHNFAGFFDNTHNFDLEKALIASMIRSAKTDPFQGTSDYLLPRTWDWDGDENTLIGKTWGPCGIWEFVLPPILRQDIWPYEEDLDTDADLLSRAITSGFAHFRVPEALVVAPIRDQSQRPIADNCGEDLTPASISKRVSILKRLGFTEFREFETVQLYHHYIQKREDVENAGLIMNDSGKAMIRRGVDELILERVPLLKLLLTKWLVHSLKSDRSDQMRLIQVLGREFSGWLNLLQYVDPGQLIRLGSAVWDLVDIIIERNGSGLTVFGTVTEMLFSAVGSRRKGWPPRSRIAPDLVDMLNEKQLPEELKKIPRNLSEAESAQSLKDKFAVPEDVFRRNKVQRKIPLIAGIATFSISRKKNSKTICPLSISLSEQVHPVEKDIHDEVAEAEPLELRRFVCELSFDTPTELSITLLHEFSMSIEFSGKHSDEHDAYVKCYERRCKCAECQWRWTAASQSHSGFCKSSQNGMDLGVSEEEESDVETSEAQTRDPRMPGAWDTDQFSRHED